MAQELARIFRMYSGTQGLTLTANQNIIDSFNIEDYSDFFSQYITATTTGNVLLQIRVGSKNYFDKPILLSLVAGSGQLSNYFPIPIRMPQKERIQLDLTNLTGVNNVVFIAFAGYEFLTGAYFKKN